MKVIRKLKVKGLHELIRNHLTTENELALIMPTHTFCKKERLVMNSGTLKAHKMQFEDIEEKFGKSINARNDYHFGLIRNKRTMFYYWVWMFQNRPATDIVNEDKSNLLPWVRQHYRVGQKAPGFHLQPNLDLIKNSIRIMEYGVFKRFFMPLRFGLTEKQILEFFSPTLLEGTTFYHT